MKKITAVLLVVSMLVACCACLSSCGLFSVSKGFVYSENHDESGEIISYDIIGVTKKILKKEKIVIPAEIRGKPVESITGSYGGFEGCLAKEIVLSEGIERIIGGFENCPNLEKLELPQSLIIVWGDAFDGSTKLGTVENGFRYVDGWVVARIEGSEHYALRGDTVGVANDISIDGIQDASGSIHFPEGLRSIGFYALEDAVIPGDVTFPATIEYLDGVVFKNAKIGGTVTLPEELTQMFNNTFYQTTISRVVINSENLHVEDDGWDGLFPECVIDELVINSNSITYDPETGNKGFERCTIKKLITHAAALAYLSAAPEVLEVTSGHIPPNVFRQNDLEELVLREGVLSVGQGAFAGCQKLAVLTAENPNLTIGQQAFYQTAIKTVCAPAAAISALPTSACTTLVVTAGRLTADSLKNATAVVDLTLSRNVTSLVKGALAVCTSLKSASVTANFVGELPKQKLEKLTVINGTVLDSSALSGATALTEITLPTSMTEIGEDAFADTTALRAVHYSGTVSDWAKIRFANAAANPLMFAKSLYVDNAVVIEALGLTEVSDYAFAGYAALSQVTFDTTMDRIGTGAFQNCTGLESVSIHRALTRIGKNAFAGCENLAGVTFEKTVDWWRYESDDLSSGNEEIREHYLTDPARAATALTINYYDYIWKNM